MRWRAVSAMVLSASARASMFICRPRAGPALRLAIKCKQLPPSWLSYLLPEGHAMAAFKARRTRATVTVFPNAAQHPANREPSRQYDAYAGRARHLSAPQCAHDRRAVLRFFCDCPGDERAFRDGGDCDLFRDRARWHGRAHCADDKNAKRIRRTERQFVRYGLFRRCARADYV